jgi:hypothetical protein
MLLQYIPPHPDGLHAYLLAVLEAHDADEDLAGSPIPRLHPKSLRPVQRPACSPSPDPPFRAHKAFAYAHTPPSLLHLLAMKPMMSLSSEVESLASLSLLTLVSCSSPSLPCRFLCCSSSIFADDRYQTGYSPSQDVPGGSFRSGQDRGLEARGGRLEQSDQLGDE